MIKIMVIDDDPHDIIKIQNALISLSSTIPYEVYAINTPEEALLRMNYKKMDLLLLDLEFSKTNNTSIYMINHFDFKIPIIIVSNLTHFQRQLSLKANVVSFIPKHKINELLVPSIVRYYKENTVRTSTDFIIPATSPGAIPECFSVPDIILISIDSFCHYRIVFSQRKPITIQSIPFSRLCNEIKKQKITDLQPVSRNQIINTNYIKSIAKQTNGRLQIVLIGIKDTINVGKKYENYFRNWFLEE